MPRLVLGAVLAAVVLVAAVLVATVLTRPSPPPIAQVVVSGRVTGAGGQTVRGIKVWLNVWPTPTAVRSLERSGLPIGVTVLGSAVSSADGAYVIRLRSLAPLAPDAANGVVRFLLMTGDRAGWDSSAFAAHLALAMAGMTVQLPSGHPVVADLNLARHTAPVMP